VLLELAETYNHPLPLSGPRVPNHCHRPSLSLSLLSMSYTNTAPINIPASLYGMAGAESPRVARRTSRPRGRNTAHGMFQFRTPSVDEPRTPSIERTPPQRRKLDPSAVLPQAPPSRGLGLPSPGKIFTRPTPSDDSSANTTTSFSEELVPNYALNVPAPVCESVHPLSAKVQRLFGACAPTRRGPGTPIPTETASAQLPLTPFESPPTMLWPPSVLPDSPASESDNADVALPGSTRGQSRPPNTEPAGPGGASHRDHTITDLTPCGKEQRFSFSFTFPPHPGFAPPSPAVPQQQPCAGCAEGRRQIEEQLQRIRWNQEVVARQLAELEQRDAGRQLREAEEQRRAESLQETRKREDTQLASLLEAMRMVAVRLVEVTTNSRRREDEHREQSERREAALRQELETAHEAQQSERKRTQEKWDALLETFRQRTETALEAQAGMAETLMRAWRDAESQRAEAVDKVRCNTDREHAAAVAEAVTAAQQEAVSQHDEAIAKVRSDADRERATAVAEAVTAAQQEAVSQHDEAIAKFRSDADRERATAVAEAVAAAQQAAVSQHDEAIAKFRNDADRERATAVAEAVAAAQQAAVSQHDEAIAKVRNDADRERATAVAEAVAAAQQAAVSQHDEAIAKVRSDADRERAAAQGGVLQWQLGNERQRRHQAEILRERPRQEARERELMLRLRAERERARANHER